MAKRISSIFSVGSSSSDHSQSTNSSRLAASVHPTQPSRDQSPARLAAKSTPELRPPISQQEQLDAPSPESTPAPNLTLPPRNDGDQNILQSPQLLSPVPIDATSNNGSRRSSIGSKRQSGRANDDYAHAFAALLKPLPIRASSPSATRPFSGSSVSGSNAGSRPSSRPSSRPASPIKSRPQTPTKEPALGRRRSWIPGKAKVEIHGEQHGEQHNANPSQAWVVTPQGKLPYDTAGLANFQKVLIKS